MSDVTASPPSIRRDAADDNEERAPRLAGWERSEHAAALAFAAFVVVGGCAIIFWVGRYFWFHGDEWNYLVERDGGNLSDLMHPRNEHLSALPIVTYRLLFNLFGLRSYTPYQVPVVALHLTTAVLLRVVMRRSGVNPWIATAGAAVFVLFGPGEETIVWGAQVGQGGTLAYGLAQLVLADHEGQSGVRDWIALMFGFFAFLSSGFVVFTAVLVGVVVLVRRGWRPAAFQTVPIGVAYVTWWIAIGPDHVADPFGRETDWLQVLDFVKTGLVTTFESIAGGHAAIGALYALVLIIGLPLAYTRFPRNERLLRMVAPLSMLVAAVVFLAVSGYGRWWIGGDVGASSRYVYVVAALVLPALAVAADALVHGRPARVAVATLVLAATIPFGVSQFDTNPPWSDAYFKSRRELIAALARSEYATQVPRSTRPDVFWSNVTTGWLLDALRRGDLPERTDANAAEDPSFRLRFGLSVIDAPSPSNNCEEVRKPIDVVLEKGDELGVDIGPWSMPRDGWYYYQSYTAQLLEDGSPVGAPLILYPGNGHLLRAELDDLNVRFGPVQGSEAFILCR